VEVVTNLACTDVIERDARQQDTRGREEGHVIGGPVPPGGRRVTSHVSSHDSATTSTEAAGHVSASRSQRRSIRGLFSFSESPRYMFHVPSRI